MQIGSSPIHVIEEVADVLTDRDSSDMPTTTTSVSLLERGCLLHETQCQPHRAPVDTTEQVQMGHVC